MKTTTVQTRTLTTDIRALTDYERTAYNVRCYNCHMHIPPEWHIDVMVAGGTDHEAVCKNCNNCVRGIAGGTGSSISPETRAYAQTGNLDGIKINNWYHATRRENWAQDISMVPDLYVHVGPKMTALDRARQTFRQARGDTIYLYEVTVSNADVFPEILRDTEDWPSFPHDLSEDEWDYSDPDPRIHSDRIHKTYVYENWFECPGSLSLYMSADAVLDTRLVATYTKFC